MKAAGVVVLCVLSFGAAWQWQAHRHAVASTEQGAVAAVLQARVDELKTQAEDADRAAAFNGEKVLAHEKTIARLRAAMRPVPVPVSPTAPVDERLAEIPNLRAGLADCRELVAVHESQAFAFREQVTSLTTARDAYRAALDAAQKRGDTLQVVATLPKYEAGIGSFVDTSAHRIRPMVYVGTRLNRSTTLGSGAVPGVGVFLIVTHSWGSK